jgi:UDP-N-acetylmuramoyl-L-alanyl-D-glutamate--2,6-diaminopimelate ligase
VLDGGDRRSAIRAALARARPIDVVAVLGRGHEPDQEIAGELVPFSDAAVVAEEWAALQGVRR